MILFLTIIPLDSAFPVQTMSDQEFIVLLEQHIEMEPTDVATALPRLSSTQQTHLSDWEQLGISVYTRACHSDASVDLLWQASSRRWDCNRLLATETEAHQWGADLTLKGYVQQQQQQLIHNLQSPYGG